MTLMSTRIRIARLRAGLSQAAMATELGVTRTAVVNWESNTSRTRPANKRLEEIAILTKVSWEWLATGRGFVDVPDENIPAADAELVIDPIERTLLKGFRASTERIRDALLTIAEAQLPAHRGKR